MVFLVQNAMGLLYAICINKEHPSEDCKKVVDVDLLELCNRLTDLTPELPQPDHAGPSIFNINIHHSNSNIKFRSLFILPLSCIKR